MSWLRKTKTHHYLWLFGLIAAGIILATAVLLILLLSKVEKRNFQPAGPSLSSQSAEQKILAVAENYAAEMRALAEFVSSTDKIDLLLTVVEEKFLQTRVPQDQREAHLQAWLEFIAFKEKSDGSDLARSKAKLLDLLSGLGLN